MLSRRSYGAHIRLKDPERRRLAMKSMQPEEREAFQVLTRAAGIEKTAKGLGFKAIGGVALTFGTGGAIQTHGNVEKSTEAALAGATATGLAGIAMRNPRVALTVAKLLKTPARTAPATVLLTELADYITAEDE